MLTSICPSEAKVMMWTGRTGRGFIKLHMLATGQTLTPENYFNQMLEKEVKPLTSRHHMIGSLIERKVFSSKEEVTFVQGGAVAHTSKAIQIWYRCQKKKLSNLS